jgi:MoxR-like ATPase
MTPGLHRFTFIGRGELSHLLERIEEIHPWLATIGPWRRFPGDEGVVDNVAYPDHPANYRASPDLADAVNTALALSKPLLLTGSPGTGKSQLAERIAWELNLGPVLRFEAQSLSEATDLFYRFDLVGHLTAVEMFKSAEKHESQGDLAAHLRREKGLPDPIRFVKLGPLGEAIVRSNPSKHEVLFNAVFGPAELAYETKPRPSVVLIDEIDKASRDFPNDLLNGIERLEFRIRELGLETMRVSEAHRPIVIITSNSERDLPPPFLRRCTFFHIADPAKEQLVAIVAQRFFSQSVQRTGDDPPPPPDLPPFYRRLVDVFWNFREQHGDELKYTPGTSELIDWTAAMRRRGADDAPFSDQLSAVIRTATCVSKHQDDHQILRKYLHGLNASA